MINMDIYLLKYMNCNSYIVFMSLFVLYFITPSRCLQFCGNLDGLHFELYCLERHSYGEVQSHILQAWICYWEMFLICFVCRVNSLHAEIHSHDKVIEIQA